MSKIVRSLQVLGSVMSSPAAATVLLNGVEVFSGQIGVGQPIDTPGVQLFTFDYEGEEFVDETLAITISVTSGVAKFGPTQVNCAGNPELEPIWGQPWGNGNDGRTQILINGLNPEWPPAPTPGPFPGGTPENPDWSGWLFDISAGETLTYEYNAIKYSTGN